MKDMGEDRWMCTLLIKNGWRLEYCAVAENRTNCPDSFEQFYGQRRRWTASTLANIISLILGLRKITQNNDSVSVLFILFQALMLFSTVISPATVILVIASGLQAAYMFSDEVALFIISLLLFVSLLYGLVCLFTSPKTQIDISKVLTFLFAIVMIIVVAGIIRGTILSIAAATMHFDNSSFNLPVSVSVMYIGMFAFTFLIAALLHPTEFFSLFHCIWYLLALPSGYLLLLIYSAANLDSQSWGTREGSSGADEGLLGWWKYIKKTWNKLILCTCCTQRKLKTPNTETIQKEDQVSSREASSLSSMYSTRFEIFL